jgi:hypothetical protein
MSIQGPSRVYDPTGTVFPTISVPSTPPVGTPSGHPAAATASLSPWAELLNKLQRLKDADPAAFRQVAGRLAETARARAGTATGPSKEDASKLADQLAQTAKTGEMPVFKPSKHHHHHRAQPTQPSGGAGMGSLLEVLLEQVDHVLGPGATSPLAPQ